MRIILFTSPSDQKILAGEKTMTARFWKIKPPQVGSLVRAQTGRKKSTAFAILRIIKVWEWSGKTYECTKEIAHKEGFENISDFGNAYFRLNVHNILENPKGRKHWFIEFELQEAIQNEDIDDSTV